MTYKTTLTMNGHDLSVRVEVKITMDEFDYGTKRQYEVEVLEVEVYADSRKNYVSVSERLSNRISNILETKSETDKIILYYRGEYVD